jgi:hypothetical protein
MSFASALAAVVAVDSSDNHRYSSVIASMDHPFGLLRSRESNRSRQLTSLGHVIAENTAPSRV